MDRPLQNQQKELTFEMKCLLFKNRPFMDDYKNKVDLQRKERAARETELLIEKMASLRCDSDDHDMNPFSESAEDLYFLPEQSGP